MAASSSNNNNSDFVVASSGLLASARADIFVGSPSSSSASPIFGSPPRTPYAALDSSSSSPKAERHIIYLDGNSLTIAKMTALMTGDYKVDLTAEAWEVVDAARRVVDRKIKNGEVVYGINTGFGNFASTIISNDQLDQLQTNLIRSHAAGTGDPLTPIRVRSLMILRINVLAKGFSGIRRETLEQYIAAFNESCLPYVPEKGTVGASGDLAPLSHLALGLMGEGRMWDESGWGNAVDKLAAHGLKSLVLGPKEGLALINGTQLITALGAEACHRARIVADTANVVGALTLEVLHGTFTAFDKGIHAARPHTGQQRVASMLRSLLIAQGKNSALNESHKDCDRVQDAYTLRCMPQIHGVAWDTISFCQGILETEMNSATDNPMIFSARDTILSGGNFHGEYPAKACDYLAIGVSELGSVSERRIDRLCNKDLNKVLPPFLVKDGGLNSGFMMAHCTASALVSENKVLVHPASCDSLTTSAGKEDHVSMGGFAARKALTVVEHVEKIVAIELLACCQGLDLLRPLTTTAPLEAVHALVRSQIPAWDKDRYFAPDIEAAHVLVKSGQVLDVVSEHLRMFME